MKRTAYFAVLIGAMLAACQGDRETNPPAPRAGNAVPTPATPAASGAGGAPATTDTAAPPHARVYFIEPRDGAVVGSPVRVVFGLAGMGVAPAGTAVANTGHHHVLIDEPAVDLAMPLPATEQVRHFGGGQTEATLELPPGRHTLQLVLGDAVHRPHRPPVVSEKITVTVK